MLTSGRSFRCISAGSSSIVDTSATCPFEVTLIFSTVDYWYVAFLLMKRCASAIVFSVTSFRDNESRANNPHRTVAASHNGTRNFEGEVLDTA
jgi:hypothetical protein